MMCFSYTKRRNKLKAVRRVVKLHCVLGFTELETKVYDRKSVSRHSLYVTGGLKSDTPPSALYSKPS